MSMRIKADSSTKITIGIFVIGIVLVYGILTHSISSWAKEYKTKEIDCIWLFDMRRNELEMFVTDLSDIEEFNKILEKNRFRPEIVKIGLSADTQIKIYTKTARPNTQGYILLFSDKRVEVMENGKIKPITNSALIEFVPKLIGKYTSQAADIKMSFWEQGLQSKDGQFQFDAARKFAEKGDQRTEAILLKALGNENWYIVHDALMSLAYLNISEVIVNALISNYKSDNIHIRRQVITTAGSFKEDDKILDLLAKALEDKDDLVSYSAAYALEQAKQTSIIPKLAKLVSHQQKYVRNHTMDVLICMRDKSLIPIFNTALQSTDIQVRWKAILGLEFLAIDNVRDRSSIPLLIEELKDKENDNHIYALGTLRQVLGSDVYIGENYPTYTKWWRENKNLLILDKSTGKFQLAITLDSLNIEVTKEMAIKLVLDYIKEQNIVVINTDAPSQIIEYDDYWHIIYEAEQESALLPTIRSFNVHKDTGSTYEVPRE